MSLLRYFFDYAQILFALWVLVDTFRLISRMTADYNRLRPFEKELLTQREESNYSPKMFLIGRSFVTLLFLVLQIEWSLDNDSWSLSLGHDSSWFIMGMLICLVWHMGNKAQLSVWKSQTVFREKEPPCGVPHCPIEDRRNQQ